jgi:hypothetical protein
MIFRCTKKVQQRLRLTPSRLSPAPEAPTLSDWYCNVVTLDDRPYFLLAHSLSLYAFYVPVAGNTTRGDFGRAFREQLTVVLALEGLLAEAGARLTDDGPDRFCPATDRRILGTMVDQAQMSQDFVEEVGGVDERVLGKLIEDINESPMRVLERHSPRFVLRAILAPRGTA